MRKSLVLIVLFYSQFLFSNIIGPVKQLIHYNRSEISEIKKQLKNNSASPAMKQAYTDLIKSANKYLDFKVSPVVEKEIMPNSKSKNDYLSISRYWWPDETKKKGLPWIRKDGDTNPDTQNDAVDRKRLGRMAKAVKVLGLAYFFSDNVEYAKKGSGILKIWFINPRTRMNPHLKYAQSVPGIDKSRRSGILDGRDIPSMVLDPIIFFSNSKYWDKEDDLVMDQWLRDYMIWLAYSPTGKDGATQENNHGTWYYYQVTAIAWYNKDMTLLKNTLPKVKKLFASQLDDEGGQHRELKRTRSYFYSCFNLDAFTRIATIAEKAGLPIWDYESPDGKNLRKAVDFLIPATKDDTKWEYKTKKGVDTFYMALVLERIKDKIDNNEYTEVLKNIVTEMSATKQKGMRKRFLVEHHLLYKPI